MSGLIVLTLPLFLATPAELRPHCARGQAPTQPERHGPTLDDMPRKSKFVDYGTNHAVRKRRKPICLAA